MAAEPAVDAPKTEHVAVQRPEPPEEVLALTADLAAIERVLEGGAEEADLAVQRFRLDRLRADIVEMMARGADCYELQMALAQAVALGVEDGRPGADHIAVALFAKAAEMAPEMGEPWFRQARLRLGMGQAKEALAALTEAQTRSDARDLDEIDLYRALALHQLGEREDALAALAPYLQRHPQDQRAQHLHRGLAAADASGGTGTISLGVEGRTLVDYEVVGATWRLSHTTLGFSIGLPLSWQIAEEQVDQGEGYVEISAPPVTGAGHAWRSDTVTIWSVALDEGADLEVLQKAYAGSFDDLADVATVDGLGHDNATRLRLRRTPFFGEPLLGEALLVVRGSTGYVLEFWGDSSSFPQTAPQAAEIMRTFEPLAAGTPVRQAG